MPAKARSQKRSLQAAEVAPLLEAELERCSCVCCRDD